MRVFFGFRYDVLSDLFIGFSAVWFGLIVIEPAFHQNTPVILMFRIASGTMTLKIANILKVNSDI